MIWTAMKQEMITKTKLYYVHHSPEWSFPFTCSHYKHSGEHEHTIVYINLQTESLIVLLEN